MRDGSMLEERPVPRLPDEVYALDLLRRVPPASQETLGRDIFARFTDDADLPCLAVVDSDYRVVGLVSRSTVLLILAKPLMFDLYYRRPVSRIMERSLLLTDMHENLDEISRRIADEHPRALMTGFVVTAQGRYAGIATATDLMTASARLAARRSRQLEEARQLAEQANLAKSVFLADLSHEIRTPLNGVLANLELLRYQPPGVGQGELIQSASLAAQALQEIIGDVLDFSKIEAGKMPVERVEMAPAALVRDVVKLMAGPAQKKGLLLSADIDPEVPDLVLSDPTRLRQVLTNFMGNALRFTETGGLFLSLSRDEDAEGRALLRFELADTGAGFRPDRADQLFHPFTQEDDSTARRFGGTGLGLAICKRLVDAMGGQIGCEGIPGGGATFWFCLPVEEVACPLPVVEDIAGLSVVLLQKRGRTRDRLTARLEEAGVDVIACATASAAGKALRIAASAGAPPTAVMADLTTDPADGLRLGEEARRQGVPSVMLTGPRDMTLRRRGHFHGYRWNVPLPVRDGRLVHALALCAGRADWAPGSQGAEQGLEHLLADLAGLNRSVAILVVDDTAMNQMVARRQLATLGFTCDVAGNGREALSRIGARAYALVLADCRMPEMDGYEMTRRLRGLESDLGLEHLPVVAMTANALQGDAEKCRQAGMDDYITKPVSLEALARTLKRWLPGGDPAAQGPVPVRPPKAPSDPDLTGGPINMQALADIVGDLEPATLVEMLGWFLASFGDLEARVEAAVASRDREALREAAHAAKGAARHAAAEALGDVLFALEQAAPATGWGEIEAMLVHLRSERARVVAHVERIRGGEQ